MKSSNKTSKSAELANAIFKQNVDFSGVSGSIYPKYKLIEGGQRVIMEVQKDKFKSFGVHHISEEGILCDDLETYIKWEIFS